MEDTQHKQTEELKEVDENKNIITFQQAAEIFRRYAKIANKNANKAAANLNKKNKRRAKSKIAKASKKKNRK